MAPPDGYAGPVLEGHPDASPGPQVSSLASPEQRVGRYRLLHRLGVGGMGEVWRAEQAGPLEWRQEVALKLLHPDLLRAHPGMLRGLRREAEIGRLLNHPRLVRTLELAEAEGLHFLVMDAVEGWNLREVLQRLETAILPPAAACELAIQALKGLEFAHTLRSPDGRPLGLVHRDLKPANLMLTRDGSVRVLDFGIAKAMNAGGDATATGLIPGTPRYMAPEQVDGAACDRRSDLFSLGACLVEALTGRPLFEAEGVTAILLAVSRADVAGKLEEVGRSAPSLVPILSRLLRRIPEERPGGAEEVRRALATVLPGLEGTSLGDVAAVLASYPAPAAPDPTERPASQPTLEPSRRNLVLPAGPLGASPVPPAVPPETVWQAPSAPVPAGGRGSAGGRGRVGLALAALGAGGALAWAVAGGRPGPGGVPEEADPGAALRSALGDPEPTPPVAAPPTPSRPQAPIPDAPRELPEPRGVREETPDPPAPVEAAGVPARAPGPRGAAKAAKRQRPEPPPAAVSVHHDPPAAATVGTLLRIAVEVAAGADVAVTCHHRPGPEGTWHVEPLERGGAGTWRGAIPVEDAALGSGRLEYFFEVRGAGTDRVLATSGSRDAPHVVRVR